jgi:Ni,Fe-hydrogenase III component G
MENEIVISKDRLLDESRKMLAAKARFAMATCLESGDNFEILYNFEPAESVSPLSTIRVVMPKQEILPSISGIYFAAVVAENEMCGDFNINISGMVLDFNRALLHTKDSVQYPLSKCPPVPKVKEGEDKPQK